MKKMKNYFNKTLSKLFRYFGNFLKLVSILYCLVLLISLSKSIIDGYFGFLCKPNFKDYPLTIKTSNFTNTTNPEFISGDNSQNYTNITFEIQNFLPVEQQLIGELKIFIPDEVLENLWYDFEYIVIKEKNETILNEQYKDYEITINSSSTYINDSEQKTPIKLSDFFQDSKNGIVSVPFTMYLTGVSFNYPSDWYKGNYLFSIELPDGVWEKNENSFSSLLPVNYYMTLNFNLKDFKILINNKNIDSANFKLNFIIVRNYVYKLYIYSMAFLPTFLTLIFICTNCKYFNSNKKLFENSFLELFAIMLAILPIRTLLVPTELPGLLNIDLLLSFSILIMVIYITIKYFLLKLEEK